VKVESLSPTFIEGETVKTTSAKSGNSFVLTVKT